MYPVFVYLPIYTPSCLSIYLPTYCPYMYLQFCYGKWFEPRGISLVISGLPSAVAVEHVVVS